MYTVGDFLIRLQNAYMAGKKQVEYPESKMVASIGKVLEKEGYVKSSKLKAQSSKKVLEIELKYENKMPAISSIKLVSKPSIRHYINKDNVKRAVDKHGIGILSTSRGVMSTRQAQKDGVGGELICKIY
ncbi:MAG TPA: 30S ribosomal protein S8 [Patescibacteria group bacterium]|nr:30S ribosomal protein S8 [Patescibacteria group bacterium]